jgi:putative component of toxin-antitoxin plasmid stabilization module
MNPFALTLTMNSLSIPPAWSHCVADSRLAKRVQHVEDGHAGDVRSVGTTVQIMLGNIQACAL